MTTITVPTPPHWRLEPTCITEIAVGDSARITITAMPGGLPRGTDAKAFEISLARILMIGVQAVYNARQPIGTDLDKSTVGLDDDITHPSWRTIRAVRPTDLKGEDEDA